MVARRVPADEEQEITVVDVLEEIVAVPEPVTLARPTPDAWWQ